MHFEVPVLGLTGRWRFSETAVRVACLDVRFRFFLIVTRSRKVAQLIHFGLSALGALVYKAPFGVPYTVN